MEVDLKNMQEGNYIELRDVVNAIDSGAMFDIVFATCDVKRGTGGQLKTLTRCVKVQGPKNKKKGDSKEVAVKKTSPRHYENSTRNIQILRSREIKKVHLRLITRFNGKPVL